MVLVQVVLVSYSQMFRGVGSGEISGQKTTTNYTVPKNARQRLIFLAVWALAVPY